MAEQLGFDLPGVAALGRDDFLVAPSNSVALAMIEGWRDWPARKFMLSGPRGSGKTHLAHVWAGLSGARVIPAAGLLDDAVPELARGNVAVEDVDRIRDIPEAQTALFHLHNLTLAEGNCLLLTGTGTPGGWGLTLRDLASRLEGTQTAILDAPDDALLSAVLAKLFADRQLAPKPDVISYLIRRIDRSFAAAGDIVARLDAVSLARKKPVTRTLAAEVLDKDGASR